MKSIKPIFALLLFTMAFLSGMGQANDACKGDIIGKRAGSSPYIVPKNCDVIVMSLNTYDSLKLQEKKLEKEIGLLDDEILLTKKGMALRDSVIQEKDAIILAQDVAIKEYKDVAADAIKAGEDATVNTDRCLDELKKQRFRTKIFTILGAAGGFVVGLITGILV